MITEDFKNRLEKAYLLADSASEAMKKALREYKESCRMRSGRIDEKLESLQEEIRVEKSRNSLRPQLMANALSDGDIDKAMDIEKEIDAANERITELEHKVSLLSGAAVKGDPELYKAAIFSYRERRKAVGKTRGMIMEVIKEINDLMEELEKVMKDAQSKLNAPYKALGDAPDHAMIDLVESVEGAIDVTGHSVGTDDMRAKQRYVHGSIRGIENTPAGRRLASKLAEKGGQIDG